MFRKFRDYLQRNEKKVIVDDIDWNEDKEVFFPKK